MTDFTLKLKIFCILLSNSPLYVIYPLPLVHHMKDFDKAYRREIHISCNRCLGLLTLKKDPICVGVC